MSFYKPSIRTVAEVAISLIGGFVIPFGLFLLFLFISGLDWEIPLVDRNPLAWILFWPDPIWHRFLSGENAETATYITIVITFSLLTFALLRLTSRLSLR